MHSLPSVSKPTGHSRIFWVITLPTCLWETEEKAMWELPILSWTFIRAEWWWHILRDRFRSNSTCTLYQVTRNQHNTPGILSWENWQSSSYLRIRKTEYTATGRLPTFLTHSSKHVHTQQYAAIFRYDFTCTLYQVTQRHSRVFEWSPYLLLFGKQKKGSCSRITNPPRTCVQNCSHLMHKIPLRFHTLSP